MQIKPDTFLELWKIDLNKDGMMMKHIGKNF